MADRKFVDARRQDVERLAQIYEKLNSAQTGEAKDEDLDDPLTKLEKSDPWIRAKEVSQRVTKFLVLCAEEYGCRPQDILFATELNALNVFNAEDMPLSPEQAAAARKAAYDYYVANRDKVPSPPKRR